MGFPKGLLDFHGKPWILEQISRYRYIKNPKVYIGLGYDHERYFETIPWFKDAIDTYHEYNGVEVKLIINHQPQLGTFSTLLSVLRNIHSKDSILVQPIDVPLLNSNDLLLLCKENNTVVIPKCDAKNGHPVKLKPEFWMKLLYIDLSEENARLDYQIRLASPLSVTYFNTMDNSIYQNINSLKEWKKFIAMQLPKL